MSEEKRAAKFRIDILGLLIAGLFTVPGNDFLNFADRYISANYGYSHVFDDRSQEVKVIAVGDVMLSRVVAQKMKDNGDYNYPFLKMAPFLKDADLTFGNLESPIISGRIIKSGEMIFRADLQAVDGLKFAGFDVLGIANNHMMNFGKVGLESTIKVLDENDIRHVGGGMSEQKMREPALIDVKGMKFAFLGYTYDLNKFKYGDDYYGLADMNESRMEADVKKAKLEADAVIVSMHAGTEYKTYPNKMQRDFAHAAIDAGADLVIGHHPHVVETAEKYKNGYIIYSLGNFVFDQMWSNETRLGVVAEIIFKDKKISSINFTPIKIYDYSQPNIAGGNEARMVLDRLKF